MKKQYFVKVRETHFYVVPVEATTEEEAKEIVDNSFFGCGSLDLTKWQETAEYEHTNDIDDWDVWE